MPKHGISVTLQDDNLLWLKSRTVATKGRSLSETLDALVTAARTSGNVPTAAMRSVAGTIDVADDDPGLDRADEYIRSVMTTSVSRPILAREDPPPYATRKTKAPRRG